MPGETPDYFERTCTSKFTDAIIAGLKAHFKTSNLPTENEEM